MSEEEVERFYDMVRKCLEERDLWTDTVMKFPPQAIRYAIKHVLVRFKESGTDPELWDWCTFFSELKDYPTVDAFIGYLTAKNYIPPSRSEEIDMMLSYLESEASKLGYRLVDAETYAKTVGRYEVLERELREVKEKLRKISEEAKRYRKIVETYEKLGVISTEVVPEEVLKKLKLKPPPAVSRPLSEVIKLEDLLNDLTVRLMGLGLPKEYVDDVLTRLKPTIAEEFNKLTTRDYSAFISNMMTYVVKDILPTETMTMSYELLTKANINVRPPKPVTFHYGGRTIVAPPTIEYIKPRFDDWAEKLKAVGYTVYYSLVPLAGYITHIIHDATKPTQSITCIVWGGKLLGCNAKILAYTLDTDKKILIYMMYYSIERVMML